MVADTCVVSPAGADLVVFVVEGSPLERRQMPVDLSAVIAQFTRDSAKCHDPRQLATGP